MNKPAKRVLPLTLDEQVQAVNELAKLQEDVERLRNVVQKLTGDLRASGQRLAYETAIVDRVWKALGVTSYAEANGKAIDQIVREIRNQLYHVKDVLAFHDGNNGEKLEAIRRAVPAILCGEPDFRVDARN